MSQTEIIKKLREKTGLSVGDIKKAIDEAGNEEGAIQLLKAKGLASAEKRASREVHEGVISSYVHANKKLASVVELLCETDFVAKTEEFQTMAYDIAMHVAAMKPQTEEELLSQPFVKDGSVTIKDLINQAVARIGENIRIGKFQIFEI